MDCSKENSKNAKFCKHCGEKLIIENEELEEDLEEEREDDEKESTYPCEYCRKEFNSEVNCLRHEKNCSEKFTKKETKEISEPIKSETIHHYTQQKSNAGVVIVVIIIIVIAAIILMNMYGQQQHAASFAGQTESVIDKIFG